MTHHMASNIVLLQMSVNAGGLDPGHLTCLLK